MSTTLDVETENLRHDLIDLSSEWEALRKKFAGPAPSVPDTSDGWFEITERNLTIADSEGEFPATWAEICISTRSYFRSRFAPWALRLVDQICGGQLPFEVPDLSHPSRRSGQYSLGRSSVEVAGTNDTVIAGQRLISWSAISLEPRRFRRTADFQTAFFLWIPNLIEVISLDEGRPDEGPVEVGLVRTLCEAMEWVDDGFNAMVSKLAQKKEIPLQDDGVRDRTEALTAAQRAAYLSFVYAQQRTGRSLDDREAYEWLKDNGPSEYELPEQFDTWRRYLSEARRLLGENKYSKRGHRGHGSSIAHHDQIERIPKRFKTDDY